MTDRLHLREVSEDDLQIFFDQQRDPEANYMAAFIGRDPTDKDAFLRHWAKIMADDTIVLKTILSGSHIAGYVVCHRWFGDPEISYWLGREFWGRGIATKALSAFLEVVSDRPLHARAAHDNLASIRVLEKCGFVKTGEERGFARARGVEVKEFIFRLD